jgi:hypothetical protein
MTFTPTAYSYLENALEHIILVVYSAVSSTSGEERRKIHQKVNHMFLDHDIHIPMEYMRMHLLFVQILIHFVVLF